MNRAHRLVWSKRLNALVVASEITKGRGKGGARSKAVTISAGEGGGLSSIAAALRQSLFGSFDIKRSAAFSVAPMLIAGAIGSLGSFISEPAAAQAASIVEADSGGAVTADPVTSFNASGSLGNYVFTQNTTASTIGNGSVNFGLSIDLDSSPGADNIVSVTVNGNIQGNQSAVRAFGDGPTSGDELDFIVTSTGNVVGTPAGAGFTAQNFFRLGVDNAGDIDSPGSLGGAVVVSNIGLGGVSVVNTGGIDGDNAGAINVTSVTGTVVVTNQQGGVVDSDEADAIYIANVSNDVTVTNNGTINAGSDAGDTAAEGLKVRSIAGNVTVTNNGGLTAISNAATLSGIGGNIPDITVDLENTGSVISNTTGYAIEVAGRTGTGSGDLLDKGLNVTVDLNQSASANVIFTNNGSISSANGSGFGIYGQANGSTAYGIYISNPQAVNPSVSTADVNVSIDNSEGGSISSSGDAISIGATSTNNGTAYGIFANGRPGQGSVDVTINNDGQLASADGRGISIFANSNGSALGSQSMLSVALNARDDVVLNITNSGELYGKHGGVFIGATESASGQPDQDTLTTYSIFAAEGDITVRVVNSGNISAATVNQSLSGLTNSGVDPAAVLISGAFAPQGGFNVLVDNAADGRIENSGVGAGVRVSGLDFEGGDYNSYDDAKIRINNYGSVLANVGQAISVEDIQSNTGSALVSVYNWGDDSRIHTSNGTALDITTVRAQHNNGTGVDASVDVRNFGEISTNLGIAVNIQGVGSEALDTAVRLTNAGSIEGNVSFSFLSSSGDVGAVVISSIGGEDGGTGRPWTGQDVLVDVVNTGSIRNVGTGDGLVIEDVESARGDLLVRVDNSGDIETNGSHALDIYDLVAYKGDATVAVQNNGTMQGGIAVGFVDAAGDLGPTVGSFWQQSNAYAASVTVLNGNGTAGTGDITANNSSAIDIFAVLSQSGPASVIVNNKGELVAGEDGISVADVSSDLDTTFSTGGEFDPAGFTDVRLYGRSASVEIVNSGNITVNASGIGVKSAAIGAQVDVAGIRVDDVVSGIEVVLQDTNGSLNVGDITSSVVIANNASISVTSAGSAAGIVAGSRYIPGSQSGLLVLGPGLTDGGAFGDADNFEGAALAYAVVANGTTSLGNITASVDVLNNGDISVLNGEDGVAPVGATPGLGIGVNGVFAFLGAEDGDSGSVSAGNIEASVYVRNTGEITVDRSADSFALSPWSPVSGEDSLVYGISVSNVFSAVVTNVSATVGQVAASVLVENTNAITLNATYFGPDVYGEDAEAIGIRVTGVAALAVNPARFYGPDMVSALITGASSFEEVAANVVVNNSGAINVTADRGVAGGIVVSEVVALVSEDTVGLTNVSATVEVLNSAPITISGNASAAYGIGVANVTAVYLGEDAVTAQANVLITTTTGGITVTEGNGSSRNDDFVGIWVEDVRAQATNATATSTVAINNSGNITSSGEGIYVDTVYAGNSILSNAGDANVSVTNNGTITALGDGITIDNVGGTNSTIVAIINNGSIIGATRRAIRVDEIGVSDEFDNAPEGINQSGVVSVSLTNYGTISNNGSSATVYISEVGSDLASAPVSINITNNANSIIRAGSEALRVIRISEVNSNGTKAVVGIDNQGTLIGRVSINDVSGDVTLLNSGDWQVQDDDDSSEEDLFAFDSSGLTSGGMSTINNSGNIELFGNSTFAGMNDFINSGVVNVTLDGGAFSRVNLDFVGSNYTAQTGSTFVIDALLGNSNVSDANTSQNDIFTFSSQEMFGNVTITGVTNVTVVDSEPTVAGVNNPRGSVVIASVGDLDGTADGSFVLSSGPINKGLWQYDLFAQDDVSYNTTTGAVNGNGTADSSGEDKVWRLASTPSNQAFELPIMMTAAQEAWHRSAQAMTDRFSELRAKQNDASAPKSGMWAKVIGSTQERDLSSAYQLPSGHVGSGTNLSFNTNYDQTIYGLMLGLDGVVNTGDDSRWLLGISAGVVQSDTKFDTTGTKMDNDIATVGLYASYTSGGAFFNALIKSDSGDTDYSMSNASLNPDGGIRYTDTFSTKVFGAALEGGYRFTSPNGFLEPSIRIATAKAKIQDRDFLATSVDFEDSASTRTSISLASGYTTTWNGSRAEPYVQFSLINESDADNSVRLTSGGQSAVTVGDGDVGTQGQLALGLRVFGSKDSHGFVRAEYTGNSEIKSYAISGGLKWNW